MARRPALSRPLAARPSRGRASLLGLACGAAASVSPGSALVLAVWLLPAILLWVGERAPRHPVARCVGLAGAAGALPALAGFWRDGGGLDDAAVLATESSPVALAWAAQALAWLLLQVVPLFVRALAEARAAARRRALQAAKAQLRAEWLATAPDP